MRRQPAGDDHHRDPRRSRAGHSLTGSTSSSRCWARPSRFRGCDVLTKADNMGYGFEAAQSYRDNVLPRMLEVRRYADLLEVRVADDLWALPNYQEILFGK